MGKVSYASVERRGNEDISSMLKRFKRKVEASGHLIELRQRKQRQEAERKEWLKNLKNNRN